MPIIKCVWKTCLRASPVPWAEGNRLPPQALLTKLASEAPVLYYGNQFSSSHRWLKQRSFDPSVLHSWAGDLSQLYFLDILNYYTQKWKWVSIEEQTFEITWSQGWSQGKLSYGHAKLYGAAVVSKQRKQEGREWRREREEEEEQGEGEGRCPSSKDVPSSILGGGLSALRFLCPWDCTLHCYWAC